MMSFFLYLCVHLPWFFTVLPSCSALELEEIRPQSLHGVTSDKWLGKRDNSVFDLRNQETFLWGAEGKTPPNVQDLIRLDSNVSRWNERNAWQLDRVDAW